MSENCKPTDCSGCPSASTCGQDKKSLEDFREETHRLSDIKKKIGVVSGKGGVGKSLITSMLAIAMNRKNYSTAILDADITGPSIPKVFGIHQKAVANEDGLLPINTRRGIQIMSSNLLLENETDPVIWRGPVIAGMVKQFWTDVIWGEVDYMFIDMPPGTGDVPLTVFQSIPVEGIVIVTSPQQLVSMIVEKAVKMAKMMNVPILGIVENMSYFNCPDCNKEINIFGKSNIEEIAKENGIDVYSRVPIDPEIAKSVDNGDLENYKGEWLKDIVDRIEKL
ncbi:MAG: Mrp/NBP35 family ATP-binding protein [Andreesenia angusta]|nr:Mrp/NBP35 family ATP-binding protein [Andreesenia angusta]